MLQTHSGEVFCFLAFCASVLFIKNKSKNPIFIARKPYHLCLSKALTPHIPCIFIPMDVQAFDYVLQGTKMRFFFILPPKHFALKHIESAQNTKLRPRYTSNKANDARHYFTHIITQLHIAPSALTSPHVHNLADGLDSMRKKIESIALNLAHFVILIPSANSIHLLDNVFWTTLIERLQKMGFDIFVNEDSNHPLLSRAKYGYKACDLDFLELFALSTYAKAIIGLRCGLLEFLSQAKIPMIVLYNTTPNLSAKECLQTFSFRTYSHIWGLEDSQIFEIIYNPLHLEAIITQIMQHLHEKEANNIDKEVVDTKSISY